MDVTQIVNALLPIIQNVVAGVMQISGSGMIGMAKELKAVSDYAGEAAQKYGDNPVVAGILEHLEGNFLDNVNIEALDLNSALAAVGSVDSLLPADLAGTAKLFIYELAERVASASGQGLFGTGEKVTGIESQYLDALRAHLGL